MTESSARSQLEEMERDRLSVYVARSEAPWWYFPFLGIGLVLASNELPHPAMTVAVAVVFAAGVGWSVGRVLRKTGMSPRLRDMPAPLLRPILVFMAMVGVVVLAIVVTFLDAPWGFLELGVVGGLVVGVGGWVSSRVYESRARRMADEKGIER